jgi:RHS repeat-associated protein
MAPPNATVDFTYDLRGRLIGEERTSVGSDDYNFSYTYDQLGNRLTKTDNLADPPERVRYLYDVTDPANCPEGFETHNNRLMKCVEETFVESLRGGDWVETRQVAYTYYRTGHASNITIKDYSSEVYRDLAMYYDVRGRLVIALWDSWEIEKGDVVNYAREKAVEFRYDNTDARQRYMMRALDKNELPDIVPLASPLGQWVEYSGSSPFLDAEYEHADDMTYAVTREYDPTVEREVGGDELHLHGDLIGSTVAATDDNEDVAGRQVYTAFGEPVGIPTLSGTRYRYAGAWGYEDGFLSLDGATGTQSITFLHIGERWYDPTLGRFIQRDPISIAGGVNVYLYADLNPSNQVDPSGLSPLRTIFGPKGPLFGRPRRGLNNGPLRIGWSWNGKQEVFSFHGGVPKTKSHFHWDAWGQGALGTGMFIFGMTGVGGACMLAGDVGSYAADGVNWATEKTTGKSLSDRIGDWIFPPTYYLPPLR